MGTEWNLMVYMEVEGNMNIISVKQVTCWYYQSCHFLSLTGFAAILCLHLDTNKTTDTQNDRKHCNCKRVGVTADGYGAW